MIQERPKIKGMIDSQIVEIFSSGSAIDYSRGLLDYLLPHFFFGVYFTKIPEIRKLNPATQPRGSNVRSLIMRL